MIHECMFPRTISNLERTEKDMVWEGRGTEENGGEGKVGNKRKKTRGGRKGKVEGRGRRWKRVEEREGRNYLDQFF